MTQCPICRAENTSAEQDSQREAYRFRCTNCGDFSLAGSADNIAQYIPDTTRWLVSAWIRNNPQLMSFNTEQLKIAQNFIRPQFLDRAHLLFRNILKKFAFSRFTLRHLLKPEPASHSFQTLLDAQAVKPTALIASYSKNLDELTFLLNQVLHKELEFLDFDDDKYVVTAKGLLWSEGHSSLKSKTGFVAMWFGGESRFQEMKQVFELGFRKGALDANLDATRVDDQPFNGKIIDQIESEIKRAPFVIADLTTNRGGVYYEAGLASGLGIPVIWTCEDEPDTTNNIHFDIQPYNQIRWKKDNLQGLAEQIKWRLSNTIK